MNHLPSTAVIARRAKPDVAISWKAGTIWRQKKMCSDPPWSDNDQFHQEIPTGFALGMT